MCGRYKLEPTPEELRSLFLYGEHPNFPPRYNIAPTQPIPIVRLWNGRRNFHLVRWGLVPSWAKEMPKSVLINARAETINDKPSFRGGFRHRRCLVPADGFYEWQARRGAPKQPFLIRRRDRKIFAMAGIWEDWLTAEGSELDSCAIVTTVANDTLAPIHQRMPVILDQGDWDTWLDVSTSTKAARSLLKPAANDLMEAVPITTRVNRVSEDDASLLEPVEVGDRSDPPGKMPREKDKDQLPLL